MKVLSLLFLASLLLGQLGGIPVYSGVVVYIHDILLVILLVEGFVQYAMRGKLVRPKLFAAIALFAGLAVLSLLANSGVFPLFSLELSSLYLLRWVFYAMLYVLVVQEFVAPAFWLWGLYATGVGLGALGLAQFFLYPDLRNLSYLGWDPHYYRLFSTFLDPNFTGIYIVLTLFLGMYLWQERKMRIWVAGGQIVAFVSLLLTYSRSSFLALVGGFALIALLKKQWMIILVVLAFIAVVILLPKTPGSTLNLLRTDSTFARVGNWQEGVNLMSWAPILGHGFDTLRYLSAESGDVISKSASGLDSSILFVGATTGILGLGAFGYLIWRMVAAGRALLKNKKMAHLGIMFLSMLVALGIDSVFINSAFYPWILIWFWILAGVVEISQ